MHIGNAQNHRSHAAHSARPDQASSKGKSAESVGFLAKAAVAETGDSAPNAIGLAASKIARMDVTVIVPPIDPPPLPETGEMVELVTNSTTDD
jgi:hypothetical protein